MKMTEFRRFAPILGLFVFNMNLTGCRSGFTAKNDGENNPHVFPTPSSTQEVLVSSSGYQLTPPVGWQRENSRRAELSIGGPAGTVPPSNILVIPYKMRPGNTLASWFETITSKSNNVYPNYYLIEKSSTKLDGEPAMYRDFFWTKLEPFHEVWTRQVFVVHRDRGFVIQCLSLARDPGAMKPVFSEVINSWRWRDEKSKQ
jgi:hypothetical protein